MNASAITNKEELREEIAKLRMIDDEQSEGLALRFNSPSAAFASMMSLFPSQRSKRRQDPVTLVARVLLPLTLNKTLFRHSNFLTRVVGGFAAQKAAGLVTEQRMESVWHSMRSIFYKLFHKKSTEKS